jgi:hypothetical protein
MLMGIGIGLVMSPMSTVAMNAVHRTKAGAASGVLSMNRMVGGTFGVAVMGALITTIGHAKINDRLPHLPAATRSALANSLGAGGGPAGHHTAPQVAAVVREAFVSALGTGLLIGAVVTLAGAVLAWLLIERRTQVAAPPAPLEEPAPELTAV